MKYSNIIDARDARQAAHVQTSREAKVDARWRQGGYKRPGSLSGRKSAGRFSKARWGGRR